MAAHARTRTKWPRGYRQDGAPSTIRRAAVRFLGYVWGVLVHPLATFDALAAEPSIGWAVAVGALQVLQVWGNMALFALFGFDWLGTKPLLSDPTYVGGFGYLRISSGQWLPIFAALLPVLALYELVIVPGAAQILSKLWRGLGTFEQMVNVLTFAAVPSLLAGWLSEWLTGVPMNLLSGHPYWFVAAMNGEFGATLAAVWNVYAVAIYAVPWAWGLVLGIGGIRRVQRIPTLAAAAIMFVAFGLSMLVTSTFTR